MSEAIRIWGVDGATLSEITRQPVDLEARLEDWMHADVSVLSDDLLVIGRQLDTEGGGTLDLLCLDRAGDLVVIELKRGKTPREVVAQALDYAAWAVDLSFERIQAIGDATYPDGLDAAFRQRFGTDLPDVLNADHHLLIVASEVDARSERIIRYLSEAHGVSINAITFNYFQDGAGRELLARTHLIEPEVSEERVERRTGSKRRRRATMEDHRQLAERLGVENMFDRLVNGLATWYRPGPLKTMVSLGRRGKWVSMVNVVTSESKQGALRFNVYKHRLARDFGLTPEEIQSALPATAESWEYSADASAPENDWEGFTGVFGSLREIEVFLTLLTEAPRQPGE